MEERLHNPFFIGARGWNGPIEGWVGENQVFREDVDARSVDSKAAALDALERARGKPLSKAARAAAAAREELRGADEVLGSALFAGAVDAAAMRERVDAARAAEAAAA
jgi:hypothetical protein